MKKSLRLVALLLALCTALFSFSSCGLLLGGFYRMPLFDSFFDSEETPQTKPEVISSSAKEGEVEDFDALIAAVEQAAYEGEEADFREKLSALEDALIHLRTQESVAYINYSANCFDETVKEQYLTACKNRTDCNEKVIQLSRRLEASDALWKAVYFEDWTEEDFAFLRNHSEKVSNLIKQEDEIIAEYMALSDGEFEDGALDCFNELVSVRNDLAAENQYENYTEYAYSITYGRDYEPSRSSEIYDYVQEYVIPLYKTVKARYYANYNRFFGRLNRLKLQAILDNRYDSLGQDYLSIYISAFSPELQDRMELMLDGEHAIFTSGENASDGAFTVYLDENETPFCYFGENFQTIDVVVHEMGHFCASLYTKTEGDRVDLCELQSQGGELMQVLSMKDYLSEALFELLVDYRVMEALEYAVICCILDEFEQQIYSGNDENPDALMTEICESYGGIDYVNKNFTEILHYWRLACVETPLYYFSYGVSSLVALELFANYQEDFAGGIATYSYFLTGANDEDGFLDAVETAGLYTPFDGELYSLLTSAFG